MNQLERANQYQEEHQISDQEKPVYHITPLAGWLNDPNGFSMYQGKIHLFYQYHPYREVWGPMHWGHCVSEDFIRWQGQPVALAPDQEYDAGGCFSGSAVTFGGNHVLIYTGVSEKVQADGSRIHVQHQCLAIGDGVHYEKAENNPVIPVAMLPQGCSEEDFRDPKVWEEDGTYYLAAASRNAQQNGQVLLFASENLRDWRYLSVLADNREKYGKMWECPDFFQLGERHVLIVSPMHMQADGREFHNGNQSIAMIGEYDKQDYHFTEEQVVSLDYGTDFYAPQTMRTEDGRRIMIAWMHSWDMDVRPLAQRWDGMMTIPRELELRDGALYQNPVRELERYRTDALICENQEICGACSIPGLEGRVLDVTLEIPDGDYETFGITFAQDETYGTSFRYHRTRQEIVFDRTYAGLERDVVCQRSMRIRQPQKILKLRLILDKYSVELFVNDGIQAFSSIFYTPMEASGIVLECDQAIMVNIEKYRIALD